MKKKVIKMVSLLVMCCILVTGLAFADETPVPDKTPDNVATDGDAEPVWKTWNREDNWPDEDGYLRFWMDDLDGTKASLTLSYTFEDGDEPVSGAKVGVVRIATVTVKHGDCKYELIDALKEKYPDLSFEGMERDGFDALTKELTALKLTPDKELVTDEKGTVVFEDLPYGLYLVSENGKTGKAEKFFYFKPFIINVPFPEIKEDRYNGHWLYKVEALPKTQIKAEIPTPTPYGPKIKTGDDSNVGVFVVGFFLSIALIGILVTFTGKREDNEER